MTTFKLLYDDKEYELPVIEGTENERAFDITKLRANTGLITYDPGYANTGACQSEITFIDGEKGILKYRGLPIAEVADKCSFLGASYLVINGHLPNRQQYDDFRQAMTDYSTPDEKLIPVIQSFPRGAHPMSILSTAVSALAGFYPDALDPNISRTDLNVHIARLMSQIRAISAYAYKESIGEEIVRPTFGKSFVGNYLHMLFDRSNRPYEVDSVVEEALEKLLILHIDHEQNCSTSAVRLVGSAQTNIYSTMAAGIAALWGPLHGGANQAVMNMLGRIKDDGLSIQQVLDKAKDKNDPFRLMGFGHRVYKNFDPRANVIKKSCDAVLERLGINDPLLDIAKKLEEAALADPYFAERKLFPNVDFYSGIIYKAVGIPVDKFTVLFAVGRLPGWIAQFLEMRQDPAFRIGRPRQVYQGQTNTKFTELDQR